jgi:hypothetical protein
MNRRIMGEFWGILGDFGEFWGILGNFEILVKKS